MNFGNFILEISVDLFWEFRIVLVKADDMEVSIYVRKPYEFSDADSALCKIHPEDGIAQSEISLCTLLILCSKTFEKAEAIWLNSIGSFIFSYFCLNYR